MDTSSHAGPFLTLAKSSATAGSGSASELETHEKRKDGSKTFTASPMRDQVTYNAAVQRPRAAV
jgi:hypothetical protein